MDFYENWDVFISNIDMVPEQLDGEKLIAMVSGFSRTREQRKLLGKEAAAGDHASMVSFLNSYLPIIAGSMKKYAKEVGYNRDILMNCVEKVREQVGNTLYIDDLEYNTCHYISWLVRNEVIRYIAEKERLSKEPVVDKTEEKTESVTGTIEEIKDFMFTIESDKGTYAMTFDTAPEGLSDVKEGDQVTVTYTGELSEVDAFTGTIISVEKAN